MSRTEKFIIDTNILISSLLIKNSVSFQALEKARKKGVLLFSEATFHEFEMVLARKKFDKYLTEEERLQVIGKMYLEGVFQHVVSNEAISRDQNDDMFLNLAIESKAACIITGDKDLLVLHPFRNIPILTAADFLKLF
ncbi:MAG: putative toxin-antitoxin system toxin component, PIN family [Bacteroidetes bacterium]|nr:putative toxin-antitoxin system toxin component, PIN family [Bacteroidota bacterium]